VPFNILIKFRLHRLPVFECTGAVFFGRSGGGPFETIEIIDVDAACEKRINQKIESNRMHPFIVKLEVRYPGVDNECHGGSRHTNTSIKKNHINYSSGMPRRKTRQWVYLADPVHPPRIFSDQTEIMDITNRAGAGNYSMSMRMCSAARLEIPSSEHAALYGK
jgi:hypothetical protein